MQINAVSIWIPAIQITGGFENRYLVPNIVQAFRNQAICQAIKIILLALNADEFFLKWDKSE